MDASAGRVALADLAHEGEHVAAAAARAHPDSEAIGMHVVGAEDVAGAMPAVVVGAVRSGRVRSAQPAPAIGRRLTGPT